MEKGIITIAQGKQKYIDMAVYLAMSLKLYCPHIKRAVVTDRPKSVLNEYYDIIIPVNPSYGMGYVQKLKVYEYSPFENTLFIDADCLVVRSVEPIFEHFKKSEMSVYGNKDTSGKFFDVDFNILSKEFSVKYMIRFNGGIYYFKKSELAQKVFAECESIIKKYDELNLYKHRGLIADEAVMSIAMSKNCVEPIKLESPEMQLAGGKKTELEVLKGKCKFECYENSVAEPAIYHYGGDAYPFHVKREIFKLKLFYFKKFNKNLASFLGNLFYNPGYAIYVFVYRIYKSIFKGTKLKFTPVLPPYKYK